MLDDYPSHSIAIVGMAGRFPGADSVDELWELLLEGKTMVRPAPIERLQLPQTGDYAKKRWWGNFINDPDAFDHRFFNKSSREAQAWAPQQRILLEVTYQALESAGYFGCSSVEPRDYGCFIGAVLDTYRDNLTCHPPTAFATVGTSRPFLSGYLSHYFGWTGPSLSIDTACSSSLVAINAACRAIWSGECSRAVAGGTNVITSPFDYQNLDAAGFLSPTGQCKPFDARADGYCRGEAVAVVVLKPLADAIDAHDDILGVIVGSAVNQNYNDSHITVPHSTSQTELLRKVMKLGGVTPGETSYVEAHGTGTGAGDPVEFNSIRDALGGPQRGDSSVLHFGSIKGNIGHTEATAGVSGLIKVLLMMQHGQIPRQASYDTPNPKIAPLLAENRMAIPESVLAWNAPVRVASVHSYGAAGSNSAILVREKPPGPLPSLSLFEGGSSKTHAGSRFPLFLSAGSGNSLSRYSEKLLDYARKWRRARQGGHTASGDDLVESLTFHLARRANRALPYVLCTSVSSYQELESSLERAAFAGVGITRRAIGSRPQPVVLVFGDGASGFVGLDPDTKPSLKVFWNHMNDCDDILVSMHRRSFYPTIFKGAADEPMQDLTTLHLAHFAVQYASAKAWIESGLNVDAVVGHGLGQLAALCVAGSLSLAEALKLVIGRAALIQTHGGPESTLPRLTELVRGVEWIPPTFHFEDCSREHDHATMIPDFNVICQHTRSPVFFQQAVERVSERFSQVTWIEAGNGSDVMDLVRRSVPNRASHEHEPGHAFLSPQLAPDSLTDAFVDLWRRGYAVQYWPFHPSRKPECEYLYLPPYQFEKTRHWLPFISDSGSRVSGVARGAQVEEEPERRRELVSFIHFKDTSQSEAVFRIDPKSDRFQAMLGGHVMAGQSLAPASLYFEIIGRAALFLQRMSTSEANKEYVPTMEDLLMKSPIGRDTSAEISLTLKRAYENGKNKGDCPCWSFSIAVSSTARGKPLECSTGRIYLKKRDDAQAARDLKRLASLIGPRKYDEIFAHPQAETMTGNHIYRAFNAVVSYGPVFHGIKKVACVGHEAAGQVIMAPRPHDDENPEDQRLLDAPIMDSFMQFAGFLVNYFHNPDLESGDVFVCGQAEKIEVGGGFDPDAREWIVYSNMSIDSEDKSGSSTDAYVFEAQSKKMVMTVLGCRFSKMPKALLAQILESVGSSDDQPNQPSYFSSKGQGQAQAQAQRKSVVETMKEEWRLGRTPEDMPLSSNVNSDRSPAKKHSSSSRGSSRRPELLQILSNVTDYPVDDIKDDSTLSDLGIDSLSATEVLNDIRTILGLTIDMTSFLFFPDIRALVSHVDAGLGCDSASSGDDCDITPLPSSVATDHATTASAAMSSLISSPNHHAFEDSHPLIHKSSTNAAPSALETFLSIHRTYHHAATKLGATNFWTTIHPLLNRLVLCHTLSTLATLGCSLHSLTPGSLIPQDTVYRQVLSKHAQLVRELFRILEDAVLISSTRPEGPFVRTSAPVPEDCQDPESLYRQTHAEVLRLGHPQHANALKLVHAVGSRLASLLRGGRDGAGGVQVVFGDKDNRKALEDLYEFWPLFRAATVLVADFVARLAQAHGVSAAPRGERRDETFRILEVGAGTGGTTRYLIEELSKMPPQTTDDGRGVKRKVHYAFTDVSTSLVRAMAKWWASRNNGNDGGNNNIEMSFEVLDIERPESFPTGWENSFDVVIAANCVHATRDLVTSLGNLRRLLREDSDGASLVLVEITRRMFWADMVVGLFDGWWAFEDDRRLENGGNGHALVDERHWERVLHKAGFDAVGWSDGETPEDKTVRVITAFPRNQTTEVDGGKDEMQRFISSTREAPILRDNGTLSPQQQQQQQPVQVCLETVTYKKVGDLEIQADIYYPASHEERFRNKKSPIGMVFIWLISVSPSSSLLTSPSTSVLTALMIHGGSHIIFSRKDVRPAQTRLLLEKGLVPVSLDHRLCPEVSLSEGAMVDICDALDWARNTLPHLKRSGLPEGMEIDGERVVAIGWSSGGQLAMSLAWTGPARGLRAPDAILAFYSPTNYEDDWWRHPIQPIGAEDRGDTYDVLDAVQDTPISNYGVVSSWEPLSDPRIMTDPRCRIVLHINWKAQTLPVILGGLPSRKKAAAAAAVADSDNRRFKSEGDTASGEKNWNALPQPSLDKIVAASPFAQICRGNYHTPTFLIHGTADDLVPWQQSWNTHKALVTAGIDTQAVLLQGAPHICDLSSDPLSEGWKAVVKGYDFICSYVV
ncbi:beta-ketoacyl synthase domain-containing protein [Hypomontagnella submonticulosa]|nr:beta-ketoacyl synthase domain-containing protein [Hypomontagnella submonticulosa]